MTWSRHCGPKYSALDQELFKNTMFDVFCVVKESHLACPILSDSRPTAPRLKWACLCNRADYSWLQICAVCLRDQFLICQSAEGPKEPTTFFAAFQYAGDCAWHSVEVDLMPGMIVAGAHAVSEDEVLIFGELLFSFVLVGCCRKLLESLR